MTVHRFRLADRPATPWKNGGGATREIACWPPGAGLSDFDARVSVATIAASGPFSVFPGVDRSITLLSGEGVHLRGSGIDHWLDRVGAPYAFDGALPLHADLLGGATDDFNVMTRRGRCQARVAALTAATDWLPQGPGVLLAVRGAWRVGDADSQPLQAGEGLWWNGSSSQFACTPEAAPSAPPLLLAVAFAFAES